ncbi:Predicted DNA binding protein, contains HTH domain [Halovenus aranensis]|uniref:Predicted DNA binding protein, contains HTH domain n=1 Tax=Halovenus aranensis TaxID=890420 RepID=A0A1G8XHR0_9EURY|nr:helix-turn-helix domain-containing protein [Halovenus aranensis]SDJ89804.1 Predicted DNA binding protein, contains HTH domain [Halovenus aranensis]
MYVEFYNTSDVLQETLKSFPETRVDIRDLATSANTSLRLICVVRGTNLADFVETAAHDKMVEKVVTLSDEGNGGLVRLTLVPETVDQKVYETAVELDGLYLNARNTDHGWYVKMNFPDKHAFRAFQSRSEEYGMDIQPTVVRDRQFFLSEEAFGLTRKQQEVLAEAIKSGYFEVPRRASLSDVSDRVGISDQAASERIRRGMKTLAENGVTDYFE